MKFFDNLIDDFYNLCDSFPCADRCFESDNITSCNTHLELIMQRDTAFELEGQGFELVTSADIEDSVTLIGRDLREISGNCAFARVCVVSIDGSVDEQRVFDVIKKIEYEKYKLFPVGYMMRASTGKKAEKVRVSAKELKNGLSFYKIGNLYINKLKENPDVKGVKVYFITDDSFNYSELSHISSKNNDIIKTLDHVMSSVNFDCDSCKLKSICDEVEGLRELHFGDGMK